MISWLYFLPHHCHVWIQHKVQITFTKRICHDLVLPQAAVPQVKGPVAKLVPEDEEGASVRKCLFI